jgi:ribonucleoside-diphosphate reductase beta chain
MQPRETQWAKIEPAIPKREHWCEAGQSGILLRMVHSKRRGESVVSQDVSHHADVDEIDPATVQDARLERLEPIVPRELYYLWERRQWSAGAIDFEQDRRDWAELNQGQRDTILDGIAAIFAGEHRVAGAFSPIILAADDEQEAAFLATQQVDEARHMHFFDRLWREVLVPAEETPDKAVEGARARCNSAHSELFDRRLMHSMNRLRTNPGDVEAKIEAVTIYHLVLEGMMGLTAQHFLLDYFEKKAICPGAVQGLRYVKQDEHRHVAYGTWYLRRKCREKDRYGLMVQTILMELLPLAASVLIQGEAAGVCDGLDPLEFLGYPGAELSYYALNGLSRRMKVIGGATDEIQQFAASGAWRASRML